MREEGTETEGREGVQSHEISLQLGAFVRIRQSVLSSYIFQAEGEAQSLLNTRGRRGKQPRAHKVN